MRPGACRREPQRHLHPAVRVAMDRPRWALTHCPFSTSGWRRDREAFPNSRLESALLVAWTVRVGTTLVSAGVAEVPRAPSVVRRVGIAALASGAVGRIVAVGWRAHVAIAADAETTHGAVGVHFAVVVCTVHAHRRVVTDPTLASSVLAFRALGVGVATDQSRVQIRGPSARVVGRRGRTNRARAYRRCPIWKRRWRSDENDWADRLATPRCDSERNDRNDRRTHVPHSQEGTTVRQRHDSLTSHPGAR